MKHSLKLRPEFFAEWQAGKKTCELRKDDRVPRFEAGDFLDLREYGPWCETIETSSVLATEYTGRSLTVRVLSVLRQHEGLAEGYCLMSCERVP